MININYQGTLKEISGAEGFWQTELLLLNMLRKQKEKQFMDKIDFFSPHIFKTLLLFVSEMNNINHFYILYL